MIGINCVFGEGNPPKLKTQVIIAGPQAQELGIDRYEVSRLDDTTEIRLLSDVNGEIGHIRIGSNDTGYFHAQNNERMTAEATTANEGYSARLARTVLTDNALKDSGVITTSESGSCLICIVCFCSRESCDCVGL